MGCAQVFVTESVVKDPTTPRPSTTLTQEHSILSATGSPSRGASQVGTCNTVVVGNPFNCQIETCSFQGDHLLDHH